MLLKNELEKFHPPVQGISVKIVSSQGLSSKRVDHNKLEPHTYYYVCIYIFNFVLSAKLKN